MSKRNPRGRRFPRPLELREDTLVAPAVHADSGAATLNEGGESVATTARVDLAEAVPAGALTATGRRRRYRARLIEGDRWGASGYYPAEVLRRDGPTAFAAGTQCFLDHPTLTETVDRPARSVRDIAGRIATTPVYDGDGLYADIEVFEHAAPLVDALADTIGLSIRAAGEAEYGTVAGRTGNVVSAITEGRSVDFVTRAGAGGRLVALLEAARAGQAFAETTANETNEALGEALRAAYGGQTTYVWVRDHDSDQHTVWYEVCPSGPSPSEGRTWQQTYVMTPAGEVTLAAQRTEVEARTVYEPVAAGQVTESVRPGPLAPPDPTPRVPLVEARNVGAWIESRLHLALTQIADDMYGDGRLTRVERITLSAAIGDGLAAWTTRVQADAPQLFARDLFDDPDEAEDGPGDQPGGVEPVSAPPATDAGSPIAESTAQPVAASPPPTLEVPMSHPTGMPDTGTTAGTADITEAATRLESDLREARAARDTALAEMARLRAENIARDTAARLLAESDLPEVSRTRVGADLLRAVPLTEAGEFDTAAFTTATATAIDAERRYAAALLEGRGVGTPAGLGTTGTPTDLTEADFAAGMADIFQSIGMNEQTAKVAARGRA